MSPWLFLCGALLAGSLGQVVYKRYAHDRRLVWFLSAVVLFGLTPMCSWAALRHLSIDVVYVATSLNAFIILLLSKWLLGEEVNRHQVIGVALVFVGMLIYAL